LAFCGLYQISEKYFLFCATFRQGLRLNHIDLKKNPMERLMIRNTGLLLIALFSTSSLFAQSSKNVSIKNFTEIAVSNGIDLYLTQGSTEQIRLEGDKDLIENVAIERNGNGIRIKYKDGFSLSSLFRNKSLKAYVTYKNLSGISASGGSDVETQNPLKTDKLTLNSSGGSDLEMNIVCKDIEIHSSGGSDLALKGSATNMVLHTSGGSDVDAFNFRVDYAKVDASGGSDANVYVIKGLEANASGGSDVQYKGSASYRKTSNSRSGSVSKVD
jgi:hypothetical protein